MYIRKTVLSDIHDIMFIINHAKTALKNNKIPQWQEGYPNEITFEEDVNEGVSYVILDEELIVGTFMMSDKGDANYLTIKDGLWLTQDTIIPYLVIHRVAFHPSYKGKGLMKVLVDYVSKVGQANNCTSIRIDTHHINHPMRKSLEKENFTYCGVITLPDGNKRAGYELII